MIYRRQHYAYSAVFTARGELRQVLFLAPSVCFFLFVYEISREPLNGLRQIHMEDVLVPRSDDFEGHGQKSKNGIFRPFRWPACGLCLVEHL